MLTTLSLVLLAAVADGQGVEVTEIRLSANQAVARQELEWLARTQQHFNLDRANGTVQLETDPLIRDRMLERGLQLATMAQETQLLKSSLSARSSSKASARGIAGFECYRTVDEAGARLASLLAQHSDIAQIVDIGDSWNKANGLSGFDLKVLRLTNRALGEATNKPKVFVMSSVHAREYAPAELNLRFAEWLLSNYELDADVRWMLDSMEFHLLVHANPDGCVLAQSQVDQRKNTNQGFCAASRVGVDLNRNFPFGWGQYGGSSAVACDDTFRGPGANSEPETQSIWAYTQQLFPDRRGPLPADAAPVDTAGVFLDMHSYSNLVLWPWGYTTTASGNAFAFEALGRRLAWFNNFVPQRAVDLYVTDGTTIDTVYGELGTAAYVFEIGHMFFEPCAVFERSLAPQSLQALRYLSKVARAPYMWPQGPEIGQLEVTPDLAIPGEAVTLQAIADDSRFNTLGAAPQVQHINEARFSLGTPIWQNGASSPMAALDGTFDSVREQLSANLVAGPGEAIVYVQAKDAAGNWGPPSAQFVEVRALEELGTLRGRVLSSQDGAAVAGAVIRSNRYRSQASADGSYQRRLPRGPAVLEIVAPGFERRVISDLLVAGGEQTLDISMAPLCNRHLMDSESGLAGWQTGGNGGAGGPWRIVPANADFPTAHLSDSVGNYAPSSNHWIESPAINLSADSYVELRFDSWCELAAQDFARVEVRVGSGAYSEVFRCSADSELTKVQINSLPVVGATSMQFRFRMQSNAATQRNGWRIDNIVLAATGNDCRAQAASLFANGFEN
jgi:murein tripeptide amidase MpaA